MRKIAIFWSASLLFLLAPWLAAAEGKDSFLWRPLRIGAGGWITGMDISPDSSTRIIRTDTYGAYIWSDSSKGWRQLVTASSLPQTEVGVDKSAGVYEIRVAPNLPSRLYMTYRGRIYRSDDRGDHWVMTAFSEGGMDANDEFRTFGQKMAVDPVNPDIVFVGTPMAGVFVTRDAGATWSSIKDIPKSAKGQNDHYPGYAGIAFDASSGSAEGKTKVIYIPSYGSGVYRSADAGASWTRLAGGPNNVSNAKMSVDGTYYAIGDGSQSVWRYVSGEWSNITPASQRWDAVALDPFDPTRIVAMRQGGLLDISHDRGNSWDGIIWGPGYNHRVATDIPWLAWTNETYMSVGDILFDPKIQNRLWFAEGIGVWRTELPNEGISSPESITFVSQSRGIEQLVANEILSPPSGKPIAASWDRPVFYLAHPTSYPSAHGPDNKHAIVMGWAVDYAGDDPSFIVGLMNWWDVDESGFSSDGGRTWERFQTYPPGVSTKIGGDIAASTSKNIVWVQSNNGGLFYTKDGGETWSTAVVPGVKTSGESGWGFAYYLNRHILAADRVATGTFYVYNYLAGLFRSADGGTTWALVHPGEISLFSQFNATLKAVPGRAGHLFFSSGPQGGKDDDRHPAITPFMRSLDGGATWSAVPDVFEVRAFGFGRALNDYPTIFICGWVHRTYGLWMSQDNARSWTKIGDFPLGSVDAVKTIDGDKDIRGTVYLGFGGSGYAYGTAGGGSLD